MLGSLTSSMLLFPLRLKLLTRTMLIGEYITFIVTDINISESNLPENFSDLNVECSSFPFRLLSIFAQMITCRKAHQKSNFSLDNKSACSVFLTIEPCEYCLSLICSFFAHLCFSNYVLILAINPHEEKGICNQ